MEITKFRIVLVIAALVTITLGVVEPTMLPHEEHELQFGQNPPTPRPMRPVEIASPAELTHEVYGFLPYWEYGSYECPRYDLLTRVAYFNVVLNEYGNISNYHDWPTDDLVTNAHIYGCAVDVCITCFDAGDIGNIVNVPANRTNACHNICNVMDMGLGADGVNIDFELPSTGDHPGFYAFMRELADSVHARDSGAMLSLCLPSVDWRHTFDSDSLLPHTDALFLMGYGYYWGGSSSTGPVAPLDDPGCYYDIAYSMEFYCGDDPFKRSRFIVGLPLYGYDWPCSGDYRGASTTGSGSARFYSSCVSDTISYGCNYDTNAPAPWYVYGSYRQCWWDDARSLDEKYLWIVDNDLMGVGYWAIGYDNGDPVIWDGIEEVFGDTSSGSGDSLIVDNGDAGFITGGSWIEGSYAGGWWVDYLFCNAGSDEDWALWRPDIPEEGFYDVYMWWNAGSNRCDSVFVRVLGISNDSMFVSQKGTGASWHYLGRRAFSAGLEGNVSLSDRTAVNGSVVIADAVLWIFNSELGTPEIPPQPDEMTISAYPNPFNSSVTIAIDAPVGEGLKPYRIEIYDINGRLVEEIPINRSESAKPLSTNASRIGWTPDESIGSGVYLVSAMVSGNKGLKPLVQTKRVVYLK